MREILNNLRQSFKFILIDSPPAIAVSDAAILSVVCDGVILVFHGQRTTMVSARQALERLDAIRAPILGVVLNGVDLANPEYAYYRHYYGSDYGGPAAHQANNGGETTVETSSADIPGKEISPDKLGLGTLLGERSWEHFQRTIQEKVRSFSYADLAERELWLVELGPGNVPREFFDHMTSELRVAAGPMASIIIHDQIALLGESLETFPKSRLKELFERICVEILDQTLKREFQQRMSSEIRSLKTSHLRNS
jgi:hypothetical protein